MSKKDPKIITASEDKYYVQFVRRRNNYTVFDSYCNWKYGCHYAYEKGSVRDINKEHKNCNVDYSIKSIIDYIKYRYNFKNKLYNNDLGLYRFYTKPSDLKHYHQKIKL